MRPSAAVLLVDPKHGENVGGAIRACAAFDIPVLRWTGTRVPVSKRVARYGRLKEVGGDDSIDYRPDPDAFASLSGAGLAPVAVEVGADGIPLSELEHPPRPLYVFGPEDSSLPKSIRRMCDVQVFIPSLRCLNLAAAVNVVLYDRISRSATVLGEGG